MQRGPDGCRAAKLKCTRSCFGFDWRSFGLSVGATESSGTHELFLIDAVLLVEQLFFSWARSNTPFLRAPDTSSSMRRSPGSWTRLRRCCRRTCPARDWDRPMERSRCQRRSRLQSEWSSSALPDDCCRPAEQGSRTNWRRSSSLHKRSNDEQVEQRRRVRNKDQTHPNPEENGPAKHRGCSVHVASYHGRS